MERREYQPQVGALLRLAWQALQAELYAGLQAAGFDDLREVHRPMLRYPPIDGMRPSDLAVHLRLSKQAANDLIRDLEKLGYLTLERDPSDGRARLIRYTERGWRMYQTGSGLSHDIGQRWAQTIGQAEYDRFLGTLRTIVELNRGGEQPTGGPAPPR